MRVVGAGLVRDFIAGASTDSAGAAASWLAEARAGRWRSEEDVRSRYRDLTSAGCDVLVFGLGGSECVVARVGYGTGLVMVKHVGERGAVTLGAPASRGRR